MVARRVVLSAVRTDAVGMPWRGDGGDGHAGSRSAMSPGSSHGIPLPLLVRPEMFNEGAQFIIAQFLSNALHERLTPPL